MLNNNNYQRKWIIKFTLSPRKCHFCYHFNFQVSVQLPFLCERTNIPASAFREIENIWNPPNVKNNEIVTHSFCAIRSACSLYTLLLLHIVMPGNCKSLIGFEVSIMVTVGLFEKCSHSRSINIKQKTMAARQIYGREYIHTRVR